MWKSGDGVWEKGGRRVCGRRVFESGGVGVGGRCGRVEGVCECVDVLVSRLKNSRFRSARTMYFSFECLVP